MPTKVIPKVYHFSLKYSFSQGCADAFSEGVQFKYEGVVVSLALDIPSEREAKVVLTDDRYYKLQKLLLVSGAHWFHWIASQLGA